MGMDITAALVIISAIVAMIWLAMALSIITPAVSSQSDTATNQH